MTTTAQNLAARLARVGAPQATGGPPNHFALAVDLRDRETGAARFVPYVDMKRHGSGRDVLDQWITPAQTTFLPSVHLSCGHPVELGPAYGA